MASVHLAIAQFRPSKGDVALNIRRIGEILAQATELTPTPHVVQFAETVLSGYFVEGAVRETATTPDALATALAESFHAAGGRAAIDAVVGFYEILGGSLHNSAAYIAFDANGGARVVHVHRKNFLPTYGMFDEERFVERGFGVQAFDTSWGRAAILVCEDAWHSLSGTIAALDGAQVIFVAAAAPARGMQGGGERRKGDAAPATVARWERLIRDIADEHGVFGSLANLVGSEGGKMFPGASVVFGPRGDVRARAPLFEEALITADLDLDDIGRARADSPLLSDLRVALPTMRAELERVSGAAMQPASRASDKSAAMPATSPAASATPRPAAKPRAAGATAAPLAVVHQGDTGRGEPPSLEIDPQLVEKWLVAFLRDEFHRRGFTDAVVGVSGGVDSAVTLALAARAFGPSHVHAIRLPYRTSSPDSLAHADLIIEKLAVHARTLDISAAVDGYLASEPAASPTRRGNVMARTRMIALFDLAARHTALPLGTGNKSERLLGYFTWHADDSPPVNPIGDLFKTQVWVLARHLGVPEEIVSKPASADLVQGQTDEGDFGISYAKADVILNWLLHGWTPRELVARGFNAAEVETVRARLDGTHWKRRLPTVALLSTAAIGESYLRPVDY